MPEIPSARKEPPRVAVGDDAQRQQRVRDARLDERRTRSSSTTASGERDDRQRVRPRSASRSSRSRRRARTGRRSRCSVPGRSSRGRFGLRAVDEQPQRADRGRARRSAGSRTGTSARTSHSVRMPPSSRPTAEPPPAIAPKMPNALPRSAGSVNVVVSSAERRRREQRAEDALGARAATSTPNDSAAPPTAEATAKPSRPPMKAHLRPNRSPSAAEQQQRAEGQRVGGDDPLPGVVGEAEVLLRAGQRDVHDRHVEHDHQLGDGDQRQDQPAAVLVMGVVSGRRVLLVTKVELRSQLTRRS